MNEFVLGKSLSSMLMCVSLRKPHSPLVEVPLDLLLQRVDHSRDSVTIPLLLYVLKIPLRVALGSTLAIGLFSSSAGIIGKIATGQVPFSMAIVLILGAMPAAQLGSMRQIQRMQDSGVTILFVSHAVGDVKAIGDRTLWLDHGAIRELGETDMVVAKYLENPYWQYFCGNEYFEHALPCNPTSLVKWRQRVKWEGIEKLFQESIQVAQRSGHLKKEEIQRVNVDTTVQEKAISFPTDARLYQKARQQLVQQASREGIPLRQSYQRLGKQAFHRQGRYAHAKQMKRAQRESRKLKTWLGRVIRDIERKSELPSPKLAQLLYLAQRVYEQRRKDHGKLYSLHAPEVECIGKGKARKPYEFGVKTTIAVTHRHGLIVGTRTCPGNPYDGNTLALQLDQTAVAMGSGSACSTSRAGTRPSAATSYSHPRAPRPRPAS